MNKTDPHIRIQLNIAQVNIRLKYENFELSVLRLKCAQSYPPNLMGFD